jgi:hypothetical protein
VTGVPTKAYRLPSEWIQSNTTVVNVASFKNVDEMEILKIPGVVYIPQVGKVTVAMLQRNLMRLYEQFHYYHSGDDNNMTYIIKHEQQQQRNYDPNESTDGMHQSVDRVPTKYPQPIIQQQDPEKPWYGHPLNLYTALSVTILLIMQLTKPNK